MRLVKHFLSDPGGVWHTSELCNLMTCTRESISRACGKLLEYQIAARLLPGSYTLNPEIVASLRGKKTELRQMLRRVKNESGSKRSKRNKKGKK